MLVGDFPLASTGWNRFRQKMMRTVFAAFNFSLRLFSLDLTRLIRVSRKLAAIAKPFCCSVVDVSSSYARAQLGMLCSDKRRTISLIITFRGNVESRLPFGDPVGTRNGSSVF